MFCGVREGESSPVLQVLYHPEAGAASLHRGNAAERTETFSGQPRTGLSSAQEETGTEYRYLRFSGTSPLKNPPAVHRRVHAAFDYETEA